MAYSLEDALRIAAEGLEGCHEAIETASDCVAIESKNESAEVPMQLWVRLKNAIARVQMDMFHLEAFYYVTRVEEGRKYGPRINEARHREAQRRAQEAGEDDED